MSLYEFVPFANLALQVSPILRLRVSPRDRFNLEKGDRLPI